MMMTGVAAAAVAGDGGQWMGGLGGGGGCRDGRWPGAGSAMGRYLFVRMAVNGGDGVG